MQITYYGEEREIVNMQFPCLGGLGLWKSVLYENLSHSRKYFWWMWEPFEGHE